MFCRTIDNASLPRSNNVVTVFRMKAMGDVNYEDDSDVSWMVEDMIAYSPGIERVIKREPVARVRQKFPETWLWMGNTIGYLNSAFPFHPA